MLDNDVIRDASQMIDACLEHHTRAKAEQARLWKEIDAVKHMNMDDPAVGHRLDVLDAQIALLQRVFGFP